MANNYLELLRQIRDTVADWIGGDNGDKIKERFSQHIDRVLKLLEEHKAAEKRDDEKLKKWFNTPDGQTYTQKHQQWCKDYKAGRDIGPRPKKPAGLEGELPENPYEWFSLPLKSNLTDQQKRTRNYVLLFIIHDGYNWWRGDATLYIRQNLCKTNTFVDVLWWTGCGLQKPIREETGYERLINESLQDVEKSLKSLLSGVKDEPNKRRPPLTKAFKNTLAEDESLIHDSKEWTKKAMKHLTAWGYIKKLNEDSIKSIMSKIRKEQENKRK